MRHPNRKIREMKEKTGYRFLVLGLFANPCYNEKTGINISYIEVDEWTISSI